MYFCLSRYKEEEEFYRYTPPEPPPAIHHNVYDGGRGRHDRRRYSRAVAAYNGNDAYGDDRLAWQTPYEHDASRSTEEEDGRRRNRNRYSSTQ